MTSELGVSIEHVYHVGKQEKELLRSHFRSDNFKSFPNVLHHGSRLSESLRILLIWISERSCVQKKHCLNRQQAMHAMLLLLLHNPCRWTSYNLLEHVIDEYRNNIEQMLWLNKVLCFHLFSLYAIIWPGGRNLLLFFIAYLFSQFFCYRTC